jgi:hypothetical protein
MRWGGFGDTRFFGGGFHLPYASFLAELDDQLINGALFESVDLEESRYLVQRDIHIAIGTPKSGLTPRVGLLVIGRARLRRFPYRNVDDRQQELMDSFELHLQDGDVMLWPHEINMVDFDPDRLSFLLRFMFHENSAGTDEATSYNQRRQATFGFIVRHLLEVEKHLMQERLEAERPKHIFLSHSGKDKMLVKEVHDTLEAIGFIPWLDAEKMPAGRPLHRDLEEGMTSSCAAVFFITPNFEDASYIRREINSAVRQETEKGDRFRIITLLLNGATEEKVPGVLRDYVYRFSHRSDRHPGNRESPSDTAWPCKMDRLMWLGQWSFARRHFDLAPGVAERRGKHSRLTRSSRLEA